MTAKDAIKMLDEMQSQIIHGKRTFGDIADVIRNLEAVRIAALAEVCRAVEAVPEDWVNASHAANLVTPLFKAHRILAISDPSGMNDSPATNSANERGQP